MAKQVMDMETSKGISIGASKELQRNWTEKTWDFVSQKGNYDRTRLNLNFEIVKGSKIQKVDKSLSIIQKMKENLARRGILDPNDGLAKPIYRTVVNFIFGGSREQMRKLAFGNQLIDESVGADNSNIKRMPDIEDWAKDIYQFVSDKFGEDNIIGFYVHLDELNPHIHCTLLPISDNKFNYKKIFAGKTKYELSAKNMKLHNDLAAVNRKYGLDRGASVLETHAQHKTINQYRAELNEMNKKIYEHIQKQKQFSQQLHDENMIASKRVKGLTTMINNLNTEKDKIQAEIEDLKKQGGASSERIDRLQEQLTQINDKIQDKQSKLVDAQTLLADLLHQHRQLKQTYDTNVKELNELQQKKQTTAQIYIAAGILDNVADFVQSSYRNSSFEEKLKYQDTLLPDFAEYPAELISCATCLFLNYIDAATSIAQTTGGGGGPGTDWGKKDDEDDLAWIHRCLMEASKMLGKGRHKKIGR